MFEALGWIGGVGFLVCAIGLWRAPSLFFAAGLSVSLFLLGLNSGPEPGGLDDDAFRQMAMAAGGLFVLTAGAVLALRASQKKTPPE